jgi:hypothetical protein
MARDAVPEAVPDPAVGPLLHELQAQGLVSIRTVRVASTSIAAPPPPPPPPPTTTTSGAGAGGGNETTPVQPQPAGAGAGAGAGDYVRVVTINPEEDAHARELETSFVVTVIVVPTVAAVALVGTNPGGGKSLLMKSL